MVIFLVNNAFCSYEDLRLFFWKCRIKVRIIFWISSRGALIWYIVYSQVSAVASAFTALMAQRSQQHHSHFVYVCVEKLHADISLNPRVTSMSTARKLKSGSGSAVTFLTASLLLKGVRLAAANCKWRARERHSSAPSLSTFIALTLPLMWFIVPIFWLVQRRVWMELWQCVVPSAHVAKRDSTGVKQIPLISLQTTEM